MHFHHRHDLAGCTDTHDDWPPYAVAILATIDRRDLQLMTALQDQIDALATSFATALGDISAELDTLKAQSEPSADLSGLQAALAQAQALVPAAPEPAPVVDPAPVDVPADPSSSDVPAADPAQPAADGSAPDDGTVPAQSIPSVPLA